MAKEVERKFIVINDEWKSLVSHSSRFLQAYLSHRPEGIVRLRVTDNEAFLTIKGKTVGIERFEWEYKIPLSDAMEMFSHKVYEGNYLDKTRYYLNYGGYKWEIDVFHGRHEGLVLAEVELPDVNTEIILPPFVGEEVSDDSRYFNSNLNCSGLF